MKSILKIKLVKLFKVSIYFAVVLSMLYAGYLGQSNYYLELNNKRHNSIKHLGYVSQPLEQNFSSYGLNNTFSGIQYDEETKTESLLNSITITNRYNRTTSRPQVDETPRKILLFTNMRSGSSFVGAFFLQNPDIFYLFEPMKLLEMSTVLNKQAVGLIVGSNDFTYHYLVERNISTYLSQIFDCKFAPILHDAERLQPGAREQQELHQWYSRAFPKFRLEYKQFLQNVSGISQQQAQRALLQSSRAHKPYARGISRISSEKYNPHPPNITRLEEVCLKDYKHVAAKVIRGELIEHIFPLLESGVKVIHMIRDPRGATASRARARRWTKSKHEQDIRIECGRNLKNIRFIQQAANNSYQSIILENNYRFVRFEDIALNSEEMAAKIYNFIDMPMPEAVKAFLKADPSVNIWNFPNVARKKSEFDRKRESLAVLNKWRQHLDINLISYIQTHCYEVMNLLGFPIVNATQMKNYKTETVLEQLPTTLPFVLRPE